MCGTPTPATGSRGAHRLRERRADHRRPGQGPAPDDCRSSGDSHDPGENGDGIPPYYRAVGASPAAAYVFLAGSPTEHRSRGRLVAAGYRRLHTADFIVYVPGTPCVACERVGASRSADKYENDVSREHGPRDGRRGGQGHHSDLAPRSASGHTRAGAEESQPRGSVVHARAGPAGSARSDTEARGLGPKVTKSSNRSGGRRQKRPPHRVDSRRTRAPGRRAR